MKKRQVWDMISFALMLYQLFIIPLRAAFNPHRFADASLGLGVSGLELIPGWLIDAFFIVDIYMRIKHFTVVDEKRHEMIPEPHIFQKLYFKKHFVIDLMAALPIDIIMLFTGLAHPIGDYRFLNLCRVNRLLRLFRFPTYVNTTTAKIEQMFRKSDIDIHEYLQLSMIFGSIIITTHVFACVWHIIAYAETLGGMLENWQEIDGSMPHPSTDVTLDYSYFRACYFTIATITTVGYGDLVPVSTLEHGLNFVFIFFGTFLFLVIDAVESVAAENANSMSVDWNLKIGHVQKFVLTHEISPAVPHA